MKERKKKITNTYETRVKSLDSMQLQLQCSISLNCTTSITFFFASALARFDPCAKKNRLNVNFGELNRIFQSSRWEKHKKVPKYVHKSGNLPKSTDWRQVDHRIFHKGKRNGSLYFKLTIASSLVNCNAPIHGSSHTFHLHMSHISSRWSSYFPFPFLSAFSTFSSMFWINLMYCHLARIVLFLFLISALYEPYMTGT